MNEARWPEARALFEAALDLPEAERVAFVERRAGGDSELLAEVRSLLESHAGAAGFLDGTDVGVLRGLGEGEAPEIARERIGPWRIVRPLGEGGMGRVYLGERATGDYEQQVAIKVVSGGLASAEIVRRFGLERRILASLEHPGIARLLDGGTTEDGQPYFVMEYVEGTGLLEFADQRRLDLRARIALFLEVCAAVEHAHQRLVLHRDLKPSNILVGADGHPKLLDFGIGKLLQSEPEEGGTDATSTRQRWLTPGYSSPEQILALPTTTRTDVHGLGLVLFELLTGRRPRRSTGSVRALEEAVLREPPRRASTVALDGATAAAGKGGGREGAEQRAALRGTTAGRLRRQLRGDLDTILAKTLEPEPERRYPAVGELSADLTRYLKGEPVTARPASRAYRVAKFARRHRLGAAASLAGLLIAALLTTVYAVRLRRERDLARRESERAREMTDFLAQLFAGADPNKTRGATLTLRDFLREAPARVGTSRGDARVRADELHLVGEALWRSGAERDAIAPLEAALAQREATLGADHPDTGRTLTVLGAARGSIGEVEEGRKLLQRGISILERFYGEMSGELVWPLDRLSVLTFESDLAEADRLARRALRIHFHAGTPLSDRAFLLHHLAVYARGRGENRRGASLYLRSYAVSAATLGAESPIAAAALCNAARAYNELGASRRALDMQRRAQEIQEKAWSGADNTQLSACLRTGAEILVQLDQPAEARSLAERAYEMNRRLYGEDHMQTVNALAAVAWAAGAQEKIEESARLWTLFLDFQRRAGAQENAGWSWAYLAQARAKLAQGDGGGADELAARALALQRRELEKGEADFVPVLLFQADRALQRRDLAHARGLLQEATSIAHAKLTAEQRDYRLASEAWSRLEKAERRAPGGSPPNPGLRRRSARPGRAAGWRRS